MKRAKRTRVNTSLQAEAADRIRQKMIRSEKKPVLQVHDELVFEAPYASHFRPVYQNVGYEPSNYAELIIQAFAQSVDAAITSTPPDKLRAQEIFLCGSCGKEIPDFIRTFYRPGETCTCPGVETAALRFRYIEKGIKSLGRKRKWIWQISRMTG